MNEITVDCSCITDAMQLHASLYEALALPEWYGHNLDALFDCLTELWEETHLILQNWDAAADYSSSFESVFTDAAAENDCFTFSIS